MTFSVEVLDPRHDPEPPYWRALRTRAGLRADWDWTVLTAQAWGARTPQLVSVLHRDGGPCGVVGAGWAGLPARGNAYVSARDRPRLGGLHVRSPGNQSVPGWWFADPVDFAELPRRYARQMRRALGAGCLGLLLRQVGAAELAPLGGRPRLVRPTEPLWTLRTPGWSGREEWLATLSAKRRTRLRGIFRKIDRDGQVLVRVEAGTGTDPVRVADLLRHNEEKYRRRLGPLPALTGYLAALLRQPDVVSFGYSDSATGDLLGFGIVLDHPHWPVWRTWSMVPVEAGGVPHLYFYHSGRLVDWALSAGREGIVLGKGQDEVKSSYGARPVDQFAVALPIV